MQPSPNELSRAHIRVRGRVQGVGFRAHVEYQARKIGGLTGWVRNVGDDIVEAVAEGRRENIDQLIAAMQQGPRMSRVDELEVEWEMPNGEYDQFAVKSSI